MANRVRLDQALVERGLVASRSQARRMVLAGRVTVNGARADKPGTPVRDDVPMAVSQPPRYASRGGDKLEPALRESGIPVQGHVCLDMGASTGGFTDCLLQHGAAAVIGVDVGYGQLAWKLRTDPRVVVLERTNARHLSAADLPPDAPGPADVAVMDVSFIGASKVLPAIGRVCAPQFQALVLVKPQFEAGPARVESGGVVRDPGVRRLALVGVATAARELGWEVLAALPSPLRGPAGNWECFLHLARGREGANPMEDPVATLAIPDDRRSAGRQS